MLLHKSYINVAIAVILSLKLSLYDLQGRSNEKSVIRETYKTGRGQKGVWPRQKKLETGSVWFLRDQSNISR